VKHGHQLAVFPRRESVDRGLDFDERCHVETVTPLPAADKGKDHLADGTFAGIRRLTSRR
jgi:hypothetical protein